MSGLFQPFEPGGKAHHKQRAKRRPIGRLKRVPLRMVLPNMVTLLALCSGLTAIRLALEDRLELAMMAIILAAVLDALDGRLARMLKGTSRFGAELDSLTDFVNFGVAPALILYQSSLISLGNLGWIAALLYAICTGLRLARFNAALDTEQPKFSVHFFAGVPAPAGALVALLPMYFALLGGRWLTELPLLVAVYIVVIGLLMVSSLPTLSGKRFGARLPRDAVLPLMVATAGIIALLVAFTWHMLIVAALVYLALLPVGYWLRGKMAAEETASQSRRNAKTAGRDTSPASEQERQNDAPGQ